MLGQIIDALRKQPGAHDWVVRHLQKTSTQHYVIGSRPESQRTVQSEQVLVSVMNDHPARSGDGAARGEAVVTLLPGDTDDVTSRLQTAVFMASLTDNPPYGLPQAAECPGLELADRGLQIEPGAAAQGLVQQLTAALAAEPGIRLSSAEAFIEEQRIELHNSRGVHCSEVETELLFDLVLLAQGESDEMESGVAFQRRRATDLDVPALAHRYAQYARDALTANTPRTGTFPVVVSDEALAELLMSGGHSPLVFRSSAQYKYQRMSPWEVGSSIFTQAPSGDPLILYANPVLPFGTRSGSFDDEGLPAQRTLIIDNGMLRQFWAPQRYAEYLGIAATGSFGNMEIAAGNTPFAAMLDEPTPLYHIVAFSAMSPDPFTGDFVGEIRLGYEVSHGRAVPIRGGSISGNLFDALASARLSRETAFLGDYLGPRAIRFASITVAGK